MRRHRNRFASLAILATCAAGLPATAQEINNQVWLGQVGNLNSVDILQDGRGNAVGADNVALLLQQDGVGNSFTVDQIGFNNVLGTLFADVPDYARGIAQTGDFNTLEITQFNTSESGSNTIGAIQQFSSYALPDGTSARNLIIITQTSEDDGTGIGGHYIGRLVQDITGGGDTINEINITQRGGGDGLGNSVADIEQIGSGNLFTSIQSGQGNEVGELGLTIADRPIGGVRQYGTYNQVFLSQTGDENAVESIEQRGSRNQSQLLMDGHSNVISRIVQNNESWTGTNDVFDITPIGNRIFVSISGRDNGGNGGVQWIGELLQPSTLGVPGVAQGELQQIGDDNDIGLTILTGFESKFGVTQVGDSNRVTIAMDDEVTNTIDTERNESAVYQVGDMNEVVHTITGQDNAGAIQQEGHRNRIDLRQTGQFDRFTAVIFGNDNNGTGTSLFGSALVLASGFADETLLPGKIFQNGTGSDDTGLNSIAVSVLGSSNAFSLYQDGAANSIDANMTGSANALAVIQQNQGNTALVAQTGSANSMGIHQF